MTARPHTTVWAYLWDLMEEGLDTAVRRCRDDLGLHGISVATAYHSYQQLRPRATRDRIRICPEAALYFRPDPGHWRDVHLRPRVHDLARTQNPLAQLAASCARHGLDLTSWTVCLHNTALATAYPQCAQRTALDDSLGWVLCPTEPAVREYVLALCTDLARNYGLRRLELETCSFGAYGHAHHHLKDGTDLGPGGRFLLSLCFSPACMAAGQAAGIDTAALRDWVRGRLDAALAEGRPVSTEPGALCAQHAPLGAFQNLREAQVASLVREIRASIGTELSVILMGDRWHTGAVPQTMAQIADFTEVLAYARASADVMAAVRATAAAGVPLHRLVVGLQCYPPCALAATDLLANVRAALDAGAAGVSFYNYGIAPPACLDWVGRAVRTCLG